MEIPILYEDEYCLIVNKPNNILVHHSHFARNIEEPSLVERLREQGFDTPIPVHRLDHKTSGVLLVAKSTEWVKQFQELFEAKTITKTYVALVRGHVIAEGVIDSPVKNERGNYKDAITHFRCLEQVELNIPVVPYATARYSFVEFKPETGRMHQLRIHANKISHPIIGDPKHGNRHHNHFFQERFDLGMLFLHASQLAFVHPITQEKMEVSAEKPAFWNTFNQLVDQWSVSNNP